MEWLMGFGVFVINNAPALIGLILPPFVDILNRDVPRPSERFWVAVIACTLAAAALHWKEINAADPQAIAFWIAVIFTESQVVYRLYFKHSWVREKLQGAIRKEEESEVLPKA